jgi:hypothetical protein
MMVSGEEVQARYESCCSTSSANSTAALVKIVLTLVYKISNRLLTFTKHALHLAEAIHIISH